MPPSGYSQGEASSIVQFLRSCSRALQSEALRDQLTLVDALKREIRDIQALLQLGEETGTTKAVLVLTESFYERLASRTPSSAQEYERAVIEVLTEIESEIRAVHVPPGLHQRMMRSRERVSA